MKKTKPRWNTALRTEEVRNDLSHCGVCGAAVIYRNQIGRNVTTPTGWYKSKPIAEYLDEPGVMHEHQPGEAHAAVLAMSAERFPPMMGSKGEGQ